MKKSASVGLEKKSGTAIKPLAGKYVKGNSNIT